VLGGTVDSLTGLFVCGDESMAAFMICGVEGVESIDSRYSEREIREDCKNDDIDADEIRRWFLDNIINDMDSNIIIELYEFIFDPVRGEKKHPAFLLDQVIRCGINFIQIMSCGLSDRMISALALSSRVNQIENHLCSQIETSKKIPSIESQKERAKVTNGLRYDIMRRDNFHCVLCGATGKDDQLVIDHIIPIAKGGKTELDNLRTLCFSCNSGKRDKVE